MAELAITKIDKRVTARRRANALIGDDVWLLIRKLKAGEMLDLTPALDGRNMINTATSLHHALRKRGLAHLSFVRRGDRGYIVYWSE